MIKIITYKTRKQIQRIKDKIVDILLFPIRIVCTPIYKLNEKIKIQKKYSYKTILKLVQYCIDYHLNYGNFIYIVFKDWVDEDCRSSGIYGYSSLRDISWNHKRVKRKIDHIYFYQKDEYIKAVKELSGTPLSDEEKKKEFTRKMNDGKTYLAYVYYRIQDKEICKINNTERDK
jgi:hypothetical protein